MAAFKQRSNKFTFLFVFLLAFFLAYWLRHPQLIQQQWDELEGEVTRVIKDQTVVE